MQLCSAIVTVQTYYNYFSNFFIYLRKRALQHLCPSKFSKSLECASAVCDNTAVVCPNETGHFPFPTQCTKLSTALTHTTVVS